MSERTQTASAETTPALTLSDIDVAYVKWMLKVAPARRTLLLAFRAGYLARLQSKLATAKRKA